MPVRRGRVMMPGMKISSLVTSLLLVAAVAGCTSSIRPLRPIEHVQVWQAGDGTLHPLAATRPAATAPATMAALEGSAAATAPAATQIADASSTTEPATQPAGQIVTRDIDPNQTARFIYKASYDNVWKQSQELLRHMGFELDRQDYRDGVMITRSLPSAQIVEPWKRQQVNLKDAMENTLNDQRRTVRLRIEAVPGKPDFYEVSVQVLVDRQSNPTGEIGGPIFVEGSGFGRNQLALRSDYVAAAGDVPRWVPIGHDVDMEKKILDRLFQRI